MKNDQQPPSIDELRERLEKLYKANQKSPEAYDQAWTEPFRRRRKRTTSRKCGARGNRCRPGQTPIFTRTRP
jgi:hypothetical protein